MWIIDKYNERHERELLQETRGINSLSQWSFRDSVFFSFLAKGRSQRIESKFYPLYIYLYKYPVYNVSVCFWNPEAPNKELNERRRNNSSLVSTQNIRLEYSAGPCLRWNVDFNQAENWPTVKHRGTPRCDRDWNRIDPNTRARVLKIPIRRLRTWRTGRITLFFLPFFLFFFIVLFLSINRHHFFSSYLSKIFFFFLYLSFFIYLSFDRALRIETREFGG